MDVHRTFSVVRLRNNSGHSSILSYESFVVDNEQPFIYRVAYPPPLILQQRTTAGVYTQDAHAGCRYNFMAGKYLIEITDRNFKSLVLNSKIPVLVDFWADWCPPCKQLTPTIEKLANSFAGKAVIGKLDVDSSQSVATKYGIASIPTVILFSNGQIVKKFVGLRQENDYKTALNKILS